MAAQHAGGVAVLDLAGDGDGDLFDGPRTVHAFDPVAGTVAEGGAAWPPLTAMAHSPTRCPS